MLKALGGKVPQHACIYVWPLPAQFERHLVRLVEQGVFQPL